MKRNFCSLQIKTLNSAKSGNCRMKVTIKVLDNWYFCGVTVFFFSPLLNTFWSALKGHVQNVNNARLQPRLKKPLNFQKKTCLISQFTGLFYSFLPVAFGNCANRDTGKELVLCQIGVLFSYLAPDNIESFMKINAIINERMVMSILTLGLQNNRPLE